MNALDIIMLLCLVPAAYRGFRKGLVTQLIALLSVYIGAIVAFRLSPTISGFMGQVIIGSEKVVALLSFALVFTGVLIFMRFMGKIIDGTVDNLALGGLNHILGVSFATITTIVVLGILITLFESVNTSFGLVSEDRLNESVLYYPVKTIANHIFPYIKEWLAIFSS